LTYFDLLLPLCLPGSHPPQVGGYEPSGGGRENFGVYDWSWSFFFATLGLILVARAVSLWPIAWVLNWIDARDGIQTRHLSNRNLIMMWVSGLRGAIAIGLAMDLPTPHRYTMLTTTCMIVLFTTFVMGSSTPSMLHWLKVPTGHTKKKELWHPPAKGLQHLWLRTQKMMDSEEDMEEAAESASLRHLDLDGAVSVVKTEKRMLV
jgi:NhaP-type Na+/H+ or K+/H+ antiporter